MKEVFIVSAVRTPLGSFGGMLAGLSAVQLGSIAIKGALEKAGVDPKEVEEVYFGNVCSANLGQAPARQAAIGAGLGYNIPCTTINKVCASGMKSIMFGAQSIMLGQADIIVTGGMESMSNVPYYVPNARWGYKYGKAEFIDGLEKDGLLDAYDQVSMGICSDNTAKKYELSREAQDNFATRSFKLAAENTNNKVFQEEIIPVSVPQRKGDPIQLTEDEQYKKVDFAKIPTLRPAFTKDGTATAANSSPISDGASAVILVSAEKVKELGLTPIAKIIAFADAEQEPMWFTTTPTLAAPKALKRAGMDIKNIDYFEVNEAFSTVPMAFEQILGVDEDKMNVHGGALALGHPLGASGARIITTLNNVLKQKNASVGLAAICNGGGGASAMIIERVN
ncbi:MAG: acetyl-CoA C-acyltransferase [Saprospiraceae bacterium]